MAWLGMEVVGDAADLSRGEEVCGCVATKDEGLFECLLVLLY